MSNKTTIYIDFIHNLGDGKYKLEGYLGGKAVLLDDVSLDISAEKIHLKKVGRTQSQDGLELHRPVANSTFEANFQFDTIRPTKIRAKCKNKNIRIRANHFTGLADLLLSYKTYDKTIWVLRGKIIRLYPDSRIRLMWLELLTNLSVLLNWRLSFATKKLMLTKASGQKKVTRIVVAVGIVAESIVTIPQAIVLRMAYFIKKLRIKRPIWIISDRITAAGDNGEALFRYISKQEDVPADVYFAVTRKSPDYTQLNKVGKVLRQGSFKYKLLFLLSSKIISSHADVQVINPFLRQIDRYVNLFSFDFIFLQHGVIRHDLSGWLNRFNRNIKLFVTSSDTEKKSILTNAYYYQENNIVLTGLPRFDLLRSEPKNKLILAPTYRNFLVHGRTDKNGERKYDPIFKNSNYFKFYNRFMNDSKLLESLKQKNLTAELYLHPIFIAQAKDFKQNSLFKVIDYPYDYSSAFREGNILVSDHSSVMFDFAYLKKPVLYAHFDADEFYAGHTYTKSDFFDDKKDGFGPVCPDYESLLQETIKTLNSGSKMPIKYRQRVEKYFKYTDHHNAERVYRAILELDKDSRSI